METQNYSWFEKGSRNAKLIVLLSIVLISFLVVLFENKRISRDEFESETIVISEKFYQITRPQYDDPDVRSEYIEELIFELRELNRLSIESGFGDSTRAQIENVESMLNILQYRDFDDQTNRESFVNVIVFEWLSIFQSTKGAYSPQDSYSVSFFSTSAFAQSEEIARVSFVDRLISGDLDLRPLLRMVALTGSLLSIAIAGMAYVFTKNTATRSASFKVMTYLGSFVGGALFG